MLLPRSGEVDGERPFATAFVGGPIMIFGPPSGGMAHFAPSVLTKYDEFKYDVFLFFGKKLKYCFEDSINQRK